MPIGVPMALLLGGISAGGQIGSSLLARRGKQRSQTEPILSPEQEHLRTQLGQTLLRRLESPESGAQVQGIRNRARGKINRNFDSLYDRISTANARRGFGRSGATGSQATSLEIARVNEMGDLEGRLEEYLNNLNVYERDRTTRDALDFIRAGAGSKTEGETSSNAPLGQGIGSGISDMSFLLALSRLMKGGGSGIGD